MRAKFLPTAVNRVNTSVLKKFQKKTPGKLNNNGAIELPGAMELPLLNPVFSYATI